MASLEELLSKNQSLGLGTVLTNEYFNPSSTDELLQKGPTGNYGLSDLKIPSLTDDYFKMQMYKPGGTEDKDIFMGMNTPQWSNAMKAGQLGLGGINAGLGVLSYFQNKGIADAQKEVLGQQIESNRAEIDSRKNYRNALEKF